MPHTIRPTDGRQFGEAIRRACVEAALAGHQDASLSGLCHEGAFEAAVSAIRNLDLDEIAGVFVETRPSVSPGARAAASAAAATGAIAAGLLEEVAGVSEQHGPESFRRRARAVARRAVVLHSWLSSAGRKHAEGTGSRLAAQSDGTCEARRQCTERVLEIGERCAQVATLAAEVARHGPAGIRSDAVAAVRLACSAAECVLGQVEENLRGEADEPEWTLGVRKRSWRMRLLLGRAAPAGTTRSSVYPSGG